MKQATFHIGLWNYSRDFFRAAAKLRGTKERFCEHPVYYLYGHAIELALKSLLIYKGYSEKDIRKIGHNLESAWEKAMEEGLDSEIEKPMEVQQTIDLINPYYEAKELEYIVPGGKRYPTVSRMHDASEEILCAVGRSINIPKAQLNKSLVLDTRS